MSEIDAHDTVKGEHPIVRVLRTNPLAVVQICMVAFGGGVVWKEVSSIRDDLAKDLQGIKSEIMERVRQAEVRVSTVESGLREASTLASAKDDRATVKIESVQREVSAVRVDIGRIESAVQYLVRQERSKPASN
jgi:hypothetical protein